jgi:hypothetical protein
VGLQLKVAKVGHDQRVVRCVCMVRIEDKLDTARVVRLAASSCDVDAAALKEESLELDADVNTAALPL